MIRSRDRFSKAKNSRRATKNAKIKMKMKHYIDTKMMKIITARKQAFENSTLRALSQFERLQMKTITSNEMMNSETMIAVHRADSVSSRERERDTNRERSRERERRRKRREREQAALK